MRDVISDKAFLDLVERVYSAGSDPSQWRHFVDAVHGYLPGAAVSMFLSLNGTQLQDESSTAGIPQDSLAAYFNHYQFVNPYFPLYAQVKVGEVQRLSQQVTASAVKKLEFYCDWLKPAGDFTHAAGVTLVREETRQLRINLDIPDRYGHIEGAAAAFLSRISPHIKRAFEVNDQLKAAAVTRESLVHLIDKVEGAVAIVGSGGHVWQVNSEIEALARDGSLLRIRGDKRIAFRNAQTNEHYRRALAAALTQTPEATETTFPIECPAFGHGSVMVLPLRAIASIATFGANSPLALVIIRRSFQRPVFSKQLVRAHFGLTPAEAEVAILLAEGFNPQAIAETVGVSKETIRKQLSAVYAKMGVRRQAEVVARIAALAPVLRL
jgi:DNA-binding CsgD family transcriptional regulator